MASNQRELIHEQVFNSPGDSQTVQSVIQGYLVDGSRITIWGYATGQPIDVRVKVLIDDQILQHPNFPTKALAPGTALVLTTEDVFESDVIIEFDTGGTGPTKVVFKAYRTYR